MLLQNPRTETPAEGQSAPTCRHHWVIAPPNGPVSSGVCQICQEVREFHNTIEMPKWGQEKIWPAAAARRAYLATPRRVPMKGYLG